ncbi:aminodeoxychorismate lyase [Salisediminibacterium halotolerans]|uniref:aminodeoxychorismate lyase n=1 Tax=Salisediminibacterium halotolerans TaxID=517425 RepID=UPI000EB138D5|nr:aminodeoxychorismate lyase [Salisediminibacterium halotolerans]RLJ80934.1 4-amino-4-deoxychorismate lyase [Actinophytocola xinjiangensis]RPE83661.1 4-amino-4-deoxychorismate lyase [Salisediminibacterium halotolerans]TWG37859.1 4-amino-4-deoxychorismate lyase [Salisediminibacterium halotolerans]GEL06991.1 4-amino-4-deoxychorismate lyase [Salisediminibacterium halotolerans]
MFHCVNGELTDEASLQVSPFDHGFLYGMGLFETFRTYSGHPFLLDDHFHRLHASAEQMQIKLPAYDRERTLAVIYDLLKKNNTADAYFRWNITAGERGIGLPSAPYDAPNEFVFVKQLPASFPAEKQAVTLNQRRNTPETAVRMKSHHYFNNIAGRQELGNAAGVEGIFLTEDGFVSEGIVSNIFWRKGQTVFTPDLSCGCLPGTARSYIITAARKAGLQVESGRFSLAHAQAADEVWLTNAIQEIVPVSVWDEAIFSGQSGEVYRKLRSVYHQHCRQLFSLADWQYES